MIKLLICRSSQLIDRQKDRDREADTHTHTHRQTEKEREKGWRDSDRQTG